MLFIMSFSVWFLLCVYVVHNDIFSLVSTVCICVHNVIFSLVSTVCICCS